MLNDTTALFIYRAAVLAAAGSFSLAADAPILVLAAVGGLVAGYVLARLYLVAGALARVSVGVVVVVKCVAATKQGGSYGV